MNDKSKKVSARDLLLYVFYGLAPIGLLLLYLYFSGENEDKLMREEGINTECVMVAYSEGQSGVRGPKKGYNNKFEYNIGNAIYRCFVFTSVKPLPLGLKLKVRYLKTKEGKVRINFPDEYEEAYKEYGFNDYGY